MNKPLQRYNPVGKINTFHNIAVVDMIPEDDGQFFRVADALAKIEELERRLDVAVNKSFAPEDTFDS